MAEGIGSFRAEAPGPIRRAFFYRWAEARWYRHATAGAIRATPSEALELGIPKTAEETTRLL